MMPQGATVFRCGSMTSVGMGLLEDIANLPEVKLIDPYLPELKPEEGLELRRQGLTADVMVASSNAITLDGKLANWMVWATAWRPWHSGPKRLFCWWE
jgi:hypothetical protein